MLIISMYSGELQNFIFKLLEKNPIMRFTATDSIKIILANIKHYKDNHSSSPKDKRKITKLTRGPDMFISPILKSSNEGVHSFLTPPPMISAFQTNMNWGKKIPRKPMFGIKLEPIVTIKK